MNLAPAIFHKSVSRLHAYEPFSREENWIPASLR